MCARNPNHPKSLFLWLKRLFNIQCLACMKLKLVLKNLIFIPALLRKNFVSQFRACTQWANQLIRSFCSKRNSFNYIIPLILVFPTYSNPLNCSISNVVISKNDKSIWKSWKQQRPPAAHLNVEEERPLVQINCHAQVTSSI